MTDFEKAREEYLKDFEKRYDGILENLMNDKVQEEIQQKQLEVKKLQDELEEDDEIRARRQKLRQYVEEYIKNNPRDNNEDTEQKAKNYALKKFNEEYRKNHPETKNIEKDSNSDIVKPANNQSVNYDNKNTSDALQIPLGMFNLEEYKANNLSLRDSSSACKLWTKEDLIIALYNNYTIVNNLGDTVKYQWYKGRVYQSINGESIDKEHEFTFDDFAQWRILYCYKDYPLGYYRPSIAEKLKYLKCKFGI